MKRETFTSIVFLSTPGYLHILSEEGFIVEVRTFTSRRLQDILNVAEVLKVKGIAADRIKIDFKGDTVQPYAIPEENRVSICIAE